MQIQRAPCQPIKKTGSLSALQTLPTAERTISAKLFENFPKYHPGSSSAFPIPQKERHFARDRRKKHFQKFAENLTQIAPRIPQKERFFFPYDAKNRSVPQKERFLTRFSEISRNRPHAESAQTLEKLAPNDPNCRFSPPPLNTRVAHLDLSIYPPFYCLGAFNLSMYGGGGGLCLFISRHRLFAPIRLVCCFSCCFLWFFFINCLLFPSSAALQFEGKGGRKRRTR